MSFLFFVSCVVLVLFVFAIRILSHKKNDITVAPMPNTQAEAIEVLDSSVGDCEVVLNYVPNESKIICLKLLCELLGTNFIENKKLMDSIPSVIKENTTIENAKKIKDVLAVHGVEVLIKSASMPLDYEDNNYVGKAESAAIYTVVLNSVSEQSKVACLKIIRELLGTELLETKKIVESVPTTIKTDITIEEAEYIEGLFTGIAEVIIKKQS